MKKFTDSEFLTVWEVIRKHGAKYKIMFGGICFGMTTLVIGSILKMVIFNSNSIDLIQFILLTVGMFGAGIIVGIGSYRSNEEKYNRLISAPNNASPTEDS